MASIDNSDLQVNTTGLDTLPVELLEMIGKALIGDSASMSKFARSCRKTYLAMIPILNQAVVLRSQDDIPWRMMLARFPNVAGKLESLTLHFHSTPVVDATYYPLVTNFTLLLAQFNSLQTLTIKGCGWNRPMNPNPRNRVLFQDVFRQSANGTVLPKLETLNLSIGDHHVWRCDIDAILNHPRLKTLSILGAKIYCNVDLLPPKRSTPLEELTLLCCTVSPATMTSLLSAPKALTRLIYKGFPRVGWTAYGNFEADSYIEAFKEHKESIQYMDFDIFETAGFYDSPVDLFMFTALEDLTIRPELLYGTCPLDPPAGHCLLPSSLRHLTCWWVHPRAFSSFQGNIASHIRGWISHGGLPNFRTLTLETPLPTTTGWPRLETWLTVSWKKLRRGQFFPLLCHCCHYRV
ncbi:hypothetical protein BDV18DRAFT_161515 [Aspergillus unguis]